jgi:hypothetical protein
MVASPATTADEPTPSQRLASFVAKFDTANAKLIRACRSELRRLLPAAKELVYDNYNFLVIAFSASDRVGDVIVSLAAGASGLSMHFLQGASVPDPDGLLLGEGKQNRFIRLPSVDTLREPAVVSLIEVACDQVGRPLPWSGRHELIIKSISAKQRPRRR